MDDPERAGDDRTFKINFGSAAISRLLKERVGDKLKEFMRDYTDDTLVEYVIVLLRNGRSKYEARKELDVFLGGDSVPFVSWLWDHLSSNLYLYKKESSPDEMVETNPILNDQTDGHNSELEYMHGIVEKDSENEREKQPRASRIRHNKEWKGVVQEEGNLFPLRSTVTKILRSERSDMRPNIRRTPSPEPQIVRKRSRENDPEVKRDAVSHPAIGATRRLLQFAVRDAVRTVQNVSSRTEPAVKRLRSVVATSTQDPLVEERERPQKLRSVARVLKAAAEAAEDVTKNRCTGSVFDRLHGANAAKPINKQSLKFEEHILEDGEYEDPDQIRESNHVEYCQRSENDGDFTGEMTVLERITEMAVDSSSDNDGFNKVGVLKQRGLKVAQSASSANKDKNSLKLQYEEPTSTAAANTSSKIVNISVNVNTWKPPHYQVDRDVSEPDNQMAVDKREMSAGTVKPRLVEESNAVITRNEIARADIQKEPQKALPSASGSYTTSRPSDDIDSRTVFVSNVHFATTKDTLSRHFNKFGEVLKVLILNDAATGQPKGSAYVEFLRKESAESALSLNGTSFMSRILKIVRKSSMHHETAAMMGWPRIPGASPFASRLSRVPFSRGVHPGAFRARLPLKPGARSLQWKRESLSTQTSADSMKITALNSSTTSATNVPSPTGRNLTYIRPQSKVESSSGGM